MSIIISNATSNKREKSTEILQPQRYVRVIFLYHAPLQHATLHGDVGRRLRAELTIERVRDDPCRGRHATIQAGRRVVHSTRGLVRELVNQYINYISLVHAHRLYTRPTVSCEEKSLVSVTRRSSAHFLLFNQQSARSTPQHQQPTRLT